MSYDDLKPPGWLIDAPVQRKSSAEPQIAVGVRSLTQDLYNPNVPVRDSWVVQKWRAQKSAAEGAAQEAAAEASSEVQRAAAHGLTGAATSLPHAERIQASFGPEHDVSGVQAHIGAEASEACDAMGADAYATGNAVAFKQTPSLHVAAHEAAHVVQQRQGVQLHGGVGQAGDVYEQHADAVADRVVRGESAADLLAHHERQAEPSEGTSAVQHKQSSESRSTSSKEPTSAPAKTKIAGLPLEQVSAHLKLLTQYLQEQREHVRAKGVGFQWGLEVAARMLETTIEIDKLKAQSPSLSGDIAKARVRMLGPIDRIMRDILDIAHRQQALYSQGLDGILSEWNHLRVNLGAKEVRRSELYPDNDGDLNSSGSEPGPGSASKGQESGKEDPARRPVGDDIVGNSDTGTMFVALSVNTMFDKWASNTQIALNAIKLSVKPNGLPTGWAIANAILGIGIDVITARIFPSIIKAAQAVTHAGERTIKLAVIDAAKSGLKRGMAELASTLNIGERGKLRIDPEEYATHWQSVQLRVIGERRDALVEALGDAQMKESEIKRLVSEVTETALSSDAMIQLLLQQYNLALYYKSGDDSYDAQGLIKIAINVGAGHPHPSGVDKNGRPRTGNVTIEGMNTSRLTNLNQAFKDGVDPVALGMPFKLYFWEMEQVGPGREGEDRYRKRDGSLYFNNQSYLKESSGTALLRFTEWGNRVPVFTGFGQNVSFVGWSRPVS